MNKAALKELYENWLSLVRGAGKLLAEYPCPECGFVTHALIPPKGDVYDSTANCPSCLTTYFKVVDDQGSVDTTPMN